MTDAEICEQVEDSISEPIVEVDSVEIDDFLDAPSSYDALQMIQKLKKYFSQNGKSDANIHSLNLQETQIELKCKNVQSKVVTDYFN